MMLRIEQCENTRKMLRELGIPVHRIGYKILCEAIPRYAANDRQMFLKELYPALAKSLGLPNTAAVERPIRCVITAAWAERDAEVWARYFPRREKAPSNMIFIATLADRLK